MELNEIIGVGQKLKGRRPPLEVVHHKSDSSTELSAALAELAKALTDSAEGGITLKLESTDKPPAVPALSFSRPDAGPIHYLAIPEGREEEPFKEMLAFGVEDTDGDQQELRTRLTGLNRSADLLVFVASACPHCPHAVRAANAVAYANPNVSVSIVDAQRYPELAEQHKVRSVPMTVVDGELKIAEAIPATVLAEKLLTRGSGAYNDELFLSQIEGGNPEQATAAVVSGEQGSNSLLAAWKKSTMQVRVGLMMVAEEALGQDSSCLNGIVPGLIALLDADDGSLRGDTADLLGQIGDRSAVAPLERLLEDPNPDVVEIAEEALESLRGEG